MSNAIDQPMWQPSAERIAQANLTQFMREVSGRFGVDVQDYAQLYDWSVANPEPFWLAIWDYAGVVGERGERTLLDSDRMPGARWFPDARLNFAENLLRRRDDTPAIIFRGEDRVKAALTAAELHAEVSRTAQALREAGVVAGDRVAG